MKLTYQQKLEALSYRFYQNGTWTPAAGDFFTTSRADLELYQVVAVEGGIVKTRYTEGTDTISEWFEDGFLSDGFGPKRVFVPPWVMKMEHPTAVMLALHQYHELKAAAIDWLVLKDIAKTSGITIDDLRAAAEARSNG